MHIMLKYTQKSSPTKTNKFHSIVATYICIEMITRKNSILTSLKRNQFHSHVRLRFENDINIYITEY